MFYHEHALSEVGAVAKILCGTAVSGGPNCGAKKMYCKRPAPLKNAFKGLQNALKATFKLLSIKGLKKYCK